MSIKKDGPISICLIQMSSPSHYALWNALSVETLAGDLREMFGGKIIVSVTRVREKSDVDALIRRFPPDLGLVGVSVELGSLCLTRYLIDALNKRRNLVGPQPQLVLGNTIPTYIPTVFLDMCPSALVVRGEGEMAMRGIVMHLLEGSDLQDVPSLVYRQNGSDQKTPWNPPDPTLLVHPPSLDTIDEVLYQQGNALMETSRGCPWSRCSYCSIRSFRKGRMWEPLPFKRVVANIQSLMAAGIRELEFADADFIGGRTTEHTERITKLAAAIEEIARAHETQISFRVFLTPHILYRSGETDGNHRVHAALFRLKRAGLIKAFLGIESGCDSQLKRYRKGNRRKDLQHVLRMLRKDIGVEVDVGFIMFDPDLTLEEMLENIQFFRDNNLIMGNQWPFRPMRVVPGTPVCELLLASGRLGELDENLLSYSYHFSDERVQWIADAVDRLSAETREIFYALKVVSKLQFSPGKRTVEADRAAELVEANAFIYLDLMESLARMASEGIQGPGSVLSNARQQIDDLVRAIALDVESGILKAHTDFIMPRIAERNAQDQFEDGR